MSDCENYLIPGFTTQSGVTFDASLAYKTYGALSAARDNAILLPVCYGGRHADTEYFMTAGRALDPAKYFIIIPNLFGNGASSSPSNTPAPIGRGAWPDVSLYDNVHCQHRLVTEHLGIERLRLVTGFSMGGMQTFQWGALYADMIDAIAPICASSKTSPHNQLMIEGPTCALRVDAAFNDGWYESVPIKGMLAFGRVYAGWLFSQTFFREELYRNLGLCSVEGTVRWLQSYFLNNDANDLLAMARTWHLGDISANPRFGYDLKAALNAITCQAIVLPSETDLYFRVPDNELEVSEMPNAELRPIPSPWGHAAGMGVNPPDDEFIDRALRELLNED
jgi:homoserine O-acetyltransferase/O-succinyltransferase